jgi:hypothetical protein
MAWPLSPFLNQQSEQHPAIMKRLLLLIALISGVASARADLVMREQADFGSPGNLISITIKIHGDKIRQDLAGPESGDMSLIKDANTGDSIVLMRSQKMFTKPGAKTKDTNNPDAALSRPVDTGKADIVGGYDAKIFAWAADRKLWNDTNGMIETLWVAWDFTNFENIKADLARLDRANVSFPGKGMQPEISTLPGMVVKSRLIVELHGIVQTIDITLLSAKEEAVDPSIFEVPADYKEWTPPQPPSGPAP